MAWLPLRGFPLAAAWMLGTVVSLLMMGLAGRELSAELDPHHIVFYRSVLSMALLLPFVLHAGFASVRTRYVARHIVRNTVHFAAMWCWLLGLALLPLAEVFALEFSSPIWTAVLATIFLGERLSASRILAIVLGFSGILVLLRPGIAIVDPASLIVLSAALGYAISYVVTKNLVGSDSALTIVWWMSLVQFPLGGLLSIGNFVIPSPSLWPWLAVVGSAGAASHYCLSQALRHADATVVTPIDFLRLPLGALIGWAAYAEAIDPFLALGGALILAGNWVNLRRG